MTELKFLNISENKELVSKVTFAFINTHFKDNIDDFKVAKIDTNYIDGISLFNHYKLDDYMGVNCLICEATRGNLRELVALLVPIGYKYNMSSTVRKHMNARQVSVAPLEEVLNITKMEYGSINPVGLPDNIKILIDPLVFDKKLMICGSGIKSSKIMFPSAYLKSFPNAEILSNIAKRSEN